MHVLLSRAPATTSGHDYQYFNVSNSGCVEFASIKLPMEGGACSTRRRAEEQAPGYRWRRKAYSQQRLLMCVGEPRSQVLRQQSMYVFFVYSSGSAAIELKKRINMVRYCRMPAVQTNKVTYAHGI